MISTCICEATKNEVVLRNYHLPISENEKQDIALIITTLGTSSLAKLLYVRSCLEKAGERINHIHPLQFISCVFSDPELKVALLKLKDRVECISDKFFNGLYDSLNTECQLDNLKNEYIQDFATNLKVDIKALQIPISKQDWKGLIDLLITLVK